MLSCAAVLICGLLPVPPAQARAEGDGQLIWGRHNAAVAPIKSYNDGSGLWSSSADISAQTHLLRFARMVGSETAPELVEVHSNSNGQYLAHHFDGNSWTFDWSDFGAGSSTAYVPRFDLAADNAGNAVVFYSPNSTGTAEISYRTFNGSTDTWSGEQSLNALRTAGRVRQIEVVNRPGTDEFIIAWNDENFDLSAAYYDLSANSFSAEPAAALSTTLSTLGGLTEPRTQNFDLAIERSSGEALVCWSNEGITDLLCRTRTAGTGGSWAAGNTTFTTFAVEPLDMQMASNPDTGSDQIAIVGSDDLGAMNVAVWSGSAWGNYSAIDSSIDTVGQNSSNNAITWLRSGSTSEVVVTYDDLNASGIDWATWDGLSWTVEADITTAVAPASGDDTFHLLKPNPLDLDEAMLLVIDVNDDLTSKKVTFNGSTYTWVSTDDAGAAHETSINNSLPGWTTTFAYYANVPTPTLNVDIVDGSGNTVGSPSVSMSATTTSNTCQTTTGSLGTSTEKIRTTNTTGTPGWTLTIAASGGAAANWSATTDSYDFNDASGSGCTDGADADGLAGQLSIDPSGATNTVDSMCTNTGLSLGSSSAFSEGTTNNITLLSASASANTNCTWDLTGVSLSQNIPPFRLPGSYALQLTLTATAN